MRRLMRLLFRRCYTHHQVEAAEYHPFYNYMTCHFLEKILFAVAPVPGRGRRSLFSRSGSVRPPAREVIRESLNKCSPSVIKLDASMLVVLTQDFFL